MNFNNFRNKIQLHLQPEGYTTKQSRVFMPYHHIQYNLVVMALFMDTNIWSRDTTSTKGTEKLKNL